MASIEGIHQSLMPWLFKLLLFSFISSSCANETVTQDDTILTNQDKLVPIREVTTQIEDSTYSSTLPAVVYQEQYLNNQFTAEQTILPHEEGVPLSTNTGNRLPIASTGDSKVAPNASIKSPAESNIDLRTVIAIISAIIAIVSLLFNIKITKDHRQRDIRKSLYDDLLFREMFFRPFNTCLNEFIQKWSTVDKKNIDRNQIMEFITDLSKVRDMTHALNTLSGSANEKLQLLLDELELMIDNKPESEIKAKASIINIYKHFLDIQEIMMKEHFNNKVIQAKNFVDSDS